MLAVTVVIWTFGEMVFSPVGAAYIADIAPLDLRARYQAGMGVHVQPRPHAGADRRDAAVQHARRLRSGLTCFGLCLAARRQADGSRLGSRTRKRADESGAAVAADRSGPDEPVAHVD